MVSINDFKRIEEYVYEIPASYRADMQVPARFYADATLLDGVKNDKSLEQLVNTATMPGAVKYALAMPDIHQGYGFPIGGVLATELPDGVISPGGVGYDINCGVRLLATHLQREEITPLLDKLTSAIYANCPSGVGKGGSIKLKAGELDRLMESGSKWALKRGLATESDLERTEENGCLAGADAGRVSPRAKARGQGQVGTLGAGNHFIEIDVIDKISDEPVARRIGLHKGQIVVQIHCGSRGLGHQVCGDYVKRFQKTIRQYGFNLPDRELVCAPLSSPEGQDYLAAMKAAANYAFANRQVLTHHIRRSFDRFWPARSIIIIFTRSTTLPTTWPKLKPMKSTAAKSSCVFIEKALPELLAPVQRSCLPPTAISASRSWCPDPWARPAGCWLARVPR